MKLLSVLTLLILSACSTVPAPKSYTERVAAAYTGLAITNDTATILVNAGTITKDRGAKVLEKTREVRELVDVASNGVELNGALSLLKAAQAYLCADLKDNPNCVFLAQRATP